MPRKKIREYDSKRLLRKFVPEVMPGLDFVPPAVQVTESSPILKQVEANPWLKNTKLVVKPDMLFGQRGKHNLILLKASVEEADEWLKPRVGQLLNTGKLKGDLTHFIVEPFCPHEEEYYLSILVGREATTVNFSAKGGIHIEENWDSSMITWTIPNFSDLAKIDIKSHVEKTVGKKQLDTVVKVIRASLLVFDKLDFTMLEFNPWTVLEDNRAVILDTRGEVDDCAEFTTGQLWFDEVKDQKLEFPAPFGKILEPEESYISSLDAKTGASLKLTIINREARIWTLVAGGGASVIYADTVTDLGYGDDLGNYGEYSGGPNEEETYLYAKTVIRLLLDSAEIEKKKTGKAPRNRALLIGGGIANFTDVAKTFKGIVHALREVSDDLKAANTEVFIRRAGPNYVAGLALMRKLGNDLDLPIHVHGYEVDMTHIIPTAIDYINK